MSIGSSSSELTTPELRRIKQAIAGIMLVLALLIAARLWCLEGLLFPVSIVGASMADTLAGPHFGVKCSDCGHEFRCDATATPGSLEVECPNCGFAHNKIRSEDFQPGEQVLIDRWVYLLGRPQRGDIVAFTHQDDDAPRVVKRIVGMPGETIAIRRGDVIAGGQPVAKSLAQLRAQAILVHDTAHASKKEGLPKRWEPKSDETYWTEREGSYFYRAHAGNKQNSKGVVPQTDFDWLSFRYFRRGEEPHPPANVSPVLDFDVFNQASNRNLNPVSDLLLTCRASIARYGCLVFAAVDGEDRLEVHLCHDEHKLKVYHKVPEKDKKLLTETLLPHRNHDEPIDIQFALCDQHVLFGMDGRQVLAHPYQRLNLDAPQQDPQLQIGGAGARIRISQAKVYRDIYYLDPQSTARSWPAERPIPPNQYFVLGDNPPVSTDSRQWPHAEVPLASIRGRVIRPWWAQ